MLMAGILQRISPALFLRRFVLEKMPKASTCAEVGVHRGDFAAMILSVVGPRELHLIDPWRFESEKVYRRSLYGGLMGASQHRMDARYNRVSKRFSKEVGDGRVMIHRLSSTDALAKFPDDYFDWVYIDGNHLYSYVKADLDGYARKVRPGGYLTGDDYGIAGWWNHGVTKAVDEFVAHHASVRLLVHHGQFILTVPPR
jgi:hypothetical protein